MKIKTLFTLIILILLLAACQSATDQPVASSATVEPTSTIIQAEESIDPTEASIPKFEPIFEPTDCVFDIPSHHIEGKTVQCGFVIVPEDHRDPDGPTIKLAVAIFKAKDEVAQPDPTIFLSGGPGEKTIASVAPFADHLAVFNADRDLIFFDQRGVGSSEPALECPEFVEALFDILDEADPETTQHTIYETTMACKDRLIAEGHNLAAYTTKQNAADVEAIREALGYEQVNLFGGSYGSLLAQAVMRDHPENIRSVIIDSTVPMEKSLLLDIPTTAVNATLHLLDTCAEDQACSTAYPDLENVLFDLVEELNADPIAVELVNPLDSQRYDALMSGDMVFGNLVFYLYQTPIIPTLPQAIFNVANGDYELMIQLSGRKLMAYDALSRGMQFSVLCTDDLVGRTPEDYLEIRASMPPALAGNADPEDIIEYGFFAICENWPVEEADLSVKQPLISDIPTLILGGEFDPVTPPDYGRLVHEHLSNSYFFEFPTIGHSVSVANDCARSVATAFISDPSIEPDASCRESLAMEFALPIDFDDVPLEVVTISEFGIQTRVPEGWMQVAPEYFVSPDTTIELVVKEKTDESETSFLQDWGAAAPIDEFETNGYLWRVYEADIANHAAAGYIATTPSENGFFLVLIVTTPAQQEKLYDSVFLPVVEAFEFDEALKAEPNTEGNATTPETGINLIPFESEPFKISGMVPEGWAEVQPGVYARGSSAGDNTLVIQKSYAGMTTEALIEALLPGLQIEELPEPSGQHENEFFTWTLYQTSITAPGVGTFIVDLAMTELNGVPHLVILQAEEGEYTAANMYDVIFIPLVEALTPLD
jgi:pimeloyl-ACP methyl ester carboxylesterase